MVGLTNHLTKFTVFSYFIIKLFCQFCENIYLFTRISLPINITFCFTFNRILTLLWWNSRDYCNFISNFITNQITSCFCCFLNYIFWSSLKCNCCRLISMIKKFLDIPLQFFLIFLLTFSLIFLAKDKNLWPFTNI